MHERIAIRKINDDITLFDDHGDGTCYLVTGSEKALLIDTANGHVDLAADCRELTGLPITVVNTHGHCDHIFGNLYFKDAYLHPKDNELHDEHFAFDEIRELMKSIGKTPAKLLPLDVGQLFDLGAGHVLETIALQGHTQGSVGLLDRKHRILFSGDGVNTHLWMQLEESTSIAVLHESLVALKQTYGDQFDWILTGHGLGLEPATIVDELIVACEALLSGKGKHDREYKWFGGKCRAHSLSADENRCIVYQKSKL